MKRLIPFLILLFFFWACADKTPDGIISKEKMISVLTDIHLVDGYSMSVPADSASIIIPSLYQSVYQKYQIDSVQFSKSLKYYSDKPEELQKMYTQVSKNLDTLQKAEQKRMDDLIKKREKIRQDSLRRDSLKRNLKRPEEAVDSVEIWKDTTSLHNLQEIFKRKQRMFNLRKRNVTGDKRAK